MRKITKKTDSEILANNWKYPTHKKKIIEKLLEEQGDICAYCEDRLSSPAMARDVEHFNPHFKETPQDGYENWFAVSHRINTHKGSKDRWNEHLPLPSDGLMTANLDDRIWYDDGVYFAEDPEDIEIWNLLKYLLINDLELHKERRDYMKALKDLPYTPQELEAYLKRNPTQIRFPTALKYEFGISL